MAPRRQQHDMVLLALAAVALGQAIQINYGCYHPIGLICLNAALICCVLALWFGQILLPPPLPFTSVILGAYGNHGYVALGALCCGLAISGSGQEITGT